MVEIPAALARPARRSRRRFAPGRSDSLVLLLAARLGQGLVVALMVGVLGFAMMEALPGDAAFRIAAGRYGHDMVDAAAAAQVRAELGLDRPAWQRLAVWVGDLVRLDLGRSVVNGEPVSQALALQLGYSLRLAGAALVLALALALPFGIGAGLNPGGAIDRLSGMLAVLIRTTPSFLLGIALMLVLAVELRWLPAAGHARAAHLVLPSLTLGLVLAAMLSRVVRQAVHEVASGEPFRFARLKGLSLRAALWRHGLRNAAVPVVAWLGVQAALLVEGVVVVESIFGWPGIGHALTHAVFERDVPMIQGAALTLGLMVVAISLGVDLATRVLDPRGR